ncbi:MAG: hypothetical protein RLZZ301_566 [Bacteroidota bacterium]|jgi:anti-anti-sigma factor
MVWRFEWLRFISLPQKSNDKFVTFGKTNAMNFSVEPLGKVVVVRANVEKLDASNAPELKGHFLQLHKLGTNYMVLDLSQTRYCDSSGLSAILIANRLCKDTNGGFALSGLQDHVQKMVEIAQLDKVLSIAPNQEEAFDLLAS